MRIRRNHSPSRSFFVIGESFFVTDDTWRVLDDRRNANKTDMTRSALAAIIRSQVSNATGRFLPPSWVFFAR